MIKIISDFGCWLFRHRVVFLVVWVLCVLSVADVAGASQFKLSMFVQVVYLATVGALKGVVVMLLVWLLYSRLPRCLYRPGQSGRLGIPHLTALMSRAVAVLAFTLFAVLAVLNFGCYEFYGFGITRKLLLIIGQTTWREATEFLPGLWSNVREGIFSLKFGATAVALALTGWLVGRMGRRAFALTTGSLCIAGLGCFAAFAISFSSGRTAHSLLLRLAKYGREVAVWQERYDEMATMHRGLPHADTVSSQHLAHTVVVMLGESASRSHLSAYGYRLPTSPCLDAHGDSVYLFTDVIGSSASTAGNMERILSFKPDDLTWGDGLEYPLLIDVMERAGYRTYWLSNQERTGSVSNTSGVMTMGASVVRYVGAENSEDALAMRYDEVLLPQLELALADTARCKLIFLHLMGSHAEYSCRYPASYELFTARDEMTAYERPWLDGRMARRVAEYDNSIRYTDALIGRVMGLVAALDQPSVMIYFSDHGENVYDRDGTCGRGRQYVEVPFAVYCNGHYRAVADSVMSMMAAAVDRRFSTANFAHMLLTMTGSSYRWYDPTRDLLSPSYTCAARHVDEEVYDAADK